MCLSDFTCMCDDFFNHQILNIFCIPATTMKTVQKAWFAGMSRMEAAWYLAAQEHHIQTTNTALTLLRYSPKNSLRGVD